MDRIAAAVAVADKGRGRTVDACIAGHRTAWNTTTGYPDRPGKVDGRRAGGTQVDNHGLSRTEGNGNRNVEAVEKSTAWNGSLGSLRNGADRMSQEGEGIYAHVEGKEWDAGTAGLKRKSPAAAGACK